MRAKQYELLIKEKRRGDSIMNHLYAIILGFMSQAHYFSYIYVYLFLTSNKTFAQNSNANYLN